jgi:hypothetical protein
VRLLANPEWAAHLVIAAHFFSWSNTPGETAPRYLLRDRDRIFGVNFVNQVKAMGIQQVPAAPRSPWQRAYVER